MAVTLTQRRDAVLDLAENVVNIEYGNLSSLDVDVIKKCILDTLGTLVAGSPEPPCPILVDYLKEEGGKGESTIMIYGGKVPTPNAVLANATMARCLDLDDCHDERVAHPSVNVVPASLAIAERQGGASGKEVIAAVAIGEDLMLRLVGACKVNPTRQGRCASFVMGTFGAAAAAAKLLGLNVDKTVDALGIAYCQASGDMQCFTDGALSQRMHQGLAARSGVLAAILAQKGITGPKNILEGRAGYFNVYERGEYVPQALTAELGKRFWGTSVSVKPHPCCKHIQTSITATLDLVSAHDIRPADVDEIEVRGNKSTLGLSTPFERKCDPQGAVEPHFSIPWAVATAVVRRKVWIDDLSEEGVRSGRAEIMPIAKKVRARYDPALGEGDEVGPVIVQIRLKNGKVYSHRVDYAKGSPQNPMSWEEMAQRFEDCARFSARPIAKENVDKIIKMVRDLEKVEDVTQIVRLLA